MRQGETTLHHGPLLIACVLLSGCAQTLGPVKHDVSGRFSTDTVLKADGIKTVKPFEEKYRTLLYVRTNANSDKLNDFFQTSFTDMRAFKRVLQRSDIETLVIQQKLTDKVSNVSDLVGLNQLEKQIGPFLIVEPHVEFQGGYNFSATLKAIDPETGDVVLSLEKKAFNWVGLDKPLFYPLLNAFLEWTQNKEITVASEKR